MTRGDYSTTYVYEIVCKTNDIAPKYIGYTTNITQRKHYHKRNMSTTNNSMYSTMKENGGFSNWDIRILDERECSSAEEARDLLDNYQGYIREVDRPREFRCDPCDYVSNLRANYNIHCKTSKHLATINKNVPNVIQKVDQEQPNELTNLVVELVKQNKEQMTEIMKINQEQMTEIMKINQEQMKQNQQIQTQMIEICNRPTQVNNTTNNNNSFRLNVFLNETCKEAIDVNDFIDNMVITVEEIMRQATMSYEEGFAAILKDRLCDKLTIETRPIHFIDIKRETIIYKDKTKNAWVRDDGFSIQQNMCREMTKQIGNYVCENMHLLPKHIFDSVMKNSCPDSEKQRSKIMRMLMPYLCLPKHGNNGILHP